MSLSTRKLEKKWKEKFLLCHLVEQQERAFQIRFAHQLFYGRLDDSYPLEFPDAFNYFYSKRNELVQTEVVAKMLTFLHFIGIELEKEVLDLHLERFPADYPKFCRNCYYIFKTLAHYGTSFEIDKPFKDIGGNIYFLLRIASEESAIATQLDLFDDLELPDLYNRFSVFPDGYERNEVVQELFTQIEKSNDSFFITGKAGTGKSTFIQYFASHSKKRVLKLAFTGIASINVGGQTIHSFFLFPLKPMLPEDDEVFQFKDYTEKYKIIRSIDTLIIDEVSMLRSDVLEAIDYSLRINGGHPEKRFGGKQILFIGDIFQLPPVLDQTDEVEKFVFSEVYKSEYFFDSLAYKEIAPNYFEFQKSYRQKSDLDFVKLLDEVRIGMVSDESLERLNSRHLPGYEPRIDEFVINLTSTNYIATAENKKRLQSLPYTSFKFEAKITGDFRSDKYPTSLVLELKKFAQVIFIKNDNGRRFVNGTIAKVDFISQNLLEIRLQDGSAYKLEPVTWENRRYKYDPLKRRIVSEVIGTFTQFPIKLAWAITIHKSQGLSFDKVVIDLGRGAFVNGQVYTALSRCRTMEGLVLKQSVKRNDLVMDPRVVHFYLTENMIQKIVEDSD
ncbi:MAG: AAA family ATPase [bacterium]|nr:AAA family ATPase [bacterium]